MFQSPNGLQGSICSPIDFRSAIGSPSWLELPVESDKEEYFSSCTPVWFNLA